MSPYEFHEEHDGVRRFMGRYERAVEVMEKVLSLETDQIVFVSIHWKPIYRFALDIYKT